MNYPTAIVISAALVAGAIFADTSVGAPWEVGRYQIEPYGGGPLGPAAFRVDTMTGQIDIIGCVPGVSLWAIVPIQDDEPNRDEWLRQNNYHAFCGILPDVAKVLPE